MALAISCVIHGQTYQSIIILQGTGIDFLPANSIELIATYTDLSTLMSCYKQCNINPLCRTFVSDTTWPFICRLYEGLINTGSIISSSSSTSQVASLRYDTSFYDAYNQACDLKTPPFDRYLVCINQLWQCPQGTYWSGSMCLNQVYYQDLCSSSVVCRQDIGLYCSACGKCMCNPTASWNSAFCVQSICPSSVPIDQTLAALWPLDSDGDDLMHRYNGTLMGSPSFVPGYVGQAMQGGINTYVMIPHIDFYRRSFTVELWFYLTNITSPVMNLFSECISGTTEQCLHYGVTGSITLHMGFFYDDVTGTTILITDQWYHVAFVYDYDHRQQLIYLNGLLENLIISDPGAAHLYLGESGNAAIGGIPIFDKYFFGYIDHVSVTYRAKTAEEILDDASLVAYYSFDCGSTFDSGPNMLHGFANGQTTVSGQMNSALEFNSPNGYFQASGFTALGISNHSFSISLWIKPMNLSGSLFHISNQSNGTDWCDSLLGFNTTGHLIANVGNLILEGPKLTLNVWTHIVQILAVNDGIYLIVNETTYSTSGQINAADAPNQPLYITVGNGPFAGNGCASEPITNGSYKGWSRSPDPTCIMNFSLLKHLFKYLSLC